MTKKIGLMEVKQALKDGRFRDQLPIELREDVAKFLQNPGCPCNKPTFKKVLKIAGRQLLDYYGTEAELDENLETAAPELDNTPMPNGLYSEAPKNPFDYEFNYMVINCHVNELAKKLSELPKDSPKQISVARYEDQITCIINELPARSIVKK